MTIIERNPVQPACLTIPRFLIACWILAAHLVVFLEVSKASAIGKRHEGYREISSIMAFIVSEQQGLDTVPLPDVVFKPAKIDLTSLVAIQFEDPEETGLAGVVGSTSAPRLSRVQPADLDSFAIQAGLQPGQVVTVVLIVEVLPDGSVGSVSVSRGTRDPAVDAAAMDYASTLRWIPGTIDHHAQSMRIRFPVTLSRTTL